MRMTLSERQQVLFDLCIALLLRYSTDGLKENPEYKQQTSSLHVQTVSLSPANQPLLQPTLVETIRDL